METDSERKAFQEEEIPRATYLALNLIRNSAPASVQLDPALELILSTGDDHRKPGCFCFFDIQVFGHADAGIADDEFKHVFIKGVQDYFYLQFDFFVCLGQLISFLPKQPEILVFRKEVAEKREPACRVPDVFSQRFQGASVTKTFVRPLKDPALQAVERLNRIRKIRKRRFDK